MLGNLREPELRIGRRIGMTVAKRAALALAVLVAGCTSSHQPTPVPRVPTTMAAEATITGTLETVGGPFGASNRPLAGEITATGSEGTYSVSVGSDGRYSITVPAGTYTIVGRSPQYQGGAPNCHAARSVAVASGVTITVEVVCEEM